VYCLYICSFSNKLAYYAMALSYSSKMFMKSAPDGHLLLHVDPLQGLAEFVEGDEVVAVVVRLLPATL